MSQHVIKEVEDEFHNKLLILNQKTNDTFHNEKNNFEIYLSGINYNGILMLGKENSKLYSTTTIFPKFLKFTKENIPIPLQKDETIEHFENGNYFLIITTSFSKCYLFGNFLYANKFESSHGKLLTFQLEDKTIVNQLPCKITHVKSGISFIILKDEYNRFWYCGFLNFNPYGHHVSFTFELLDRGELLVDLKKKGGNRITHFEMFEKSAIVCVNDRYLYGIGCNENGQLGLGSNENSTALKKFVKIKWNLNGNLKVKEIKFNCNSTFILTTCGKIFKTIFKKGNGKNCTLQCINENNYDEEWNQIISMGSSDCYCYFLSKNGAIRFLCYKDNYLSNFKWTYDHINFNGNLEIRKYFNDFRSVKLFQVNALKPFRIGLYNDKKAIIINYETKTITELTSNFLIVNAKIVGEIISLFCLRESNDDGWRIKLLKNNVFCDVDFNCKV
ncbi:hypothetical protein ABK040_013097 [Willaertia magna]